MPRESNLVPNSFCGPDKTESMECKLQPEKFEYLVIMETQIGPYLMFSAYEWPPGIVQSPSFSKFPSNTYPMRRVHVG